MYWFKAITSVTFPKYEKAMIKLPQVSKENGSDYSESIADCSYCKKITGTLIVQNLIEEDFGGDIRICLSQEMENWLQNKNINFEKSI